MTTMNAKLINTPIEYTPAALDLAAIKHQIANWEAQLPGEGGEIMYYYGKQLPQEIHLPKNNFDIALFKDGFAIMDEKHEMPYLRIIDNPDQDRQNMLNIDGKLSYPPDCEFPIQPYSRQNGNHIIFVSAKTNTYYIYEVSHAMITRRHFNIPQQAEFVAIAQDDRYLILKARSTYLAYSMSGKRLARITDNSI